MKKILKKCVIIAAILAFVLFTLSFLNCKAYDHQNEYPSETTSYANDYSNYDYQYNDYESEGVSIFPFLIGGLVIGAGAALITFICIHNRYKFKKTPSASAYVKNGGVKFYQKSDIFTHRDVTRVRIQNDNNRQN